MSSELFNFKHFTIHHDRCSMKVGTDGVLLGSWVRISDNENSSENYDVLDIGTGSGLIAMMIAQRSCYNKIIAIDIDSASVVQAQENINASVFKDRIKARECDFCMISSEHCNENSKWLMGKTFRHIVSNPPFYEEDTASKTAQMNNAKHTTTLSFEQLINGAQQLMSDDGDFSVIIPYAAVQRFVSIAAINGLYLSRRTDVRNNERKPFKRSLLTFSKTKSPTDYSLLNIRNTDNEYSDDYISMTNDFYL